VRAQDHGIAEIGCSAEIVAVTKEYPDGKLDLLAEGRTRFEVLELHHERSFLQADVLFVPDDPGAASDAGRERAIQLHRSILVLAGAMQDLSAAQRETLSFHLAGSLPLDLDFKQKLLGMRNEGERIHALSAYLESLLPNLLRASKARDKAGGNGRVH